VIRVRAKFLINRHAKIFEKKIVPLFRGYRWLHHAKIDENGVCRESRDVVEGWNLHRGLLGVAVAAGGPAKGAGIRKRRSHFR
jgi:hypothetical protein